MAKQKDSTNKDYTPARVWEPKENLGGKWGSINQPTAGARFDKELPVGDNPIQLYSLATPNGVKIGIMLEELLEAVENGAKYDAYLINIGEGDQFSSGFVAANPNSKIPVIVDHSSDKPLRVFESGAILLYLAEKFQKFIPKDPIKRTECLNWLFWQMGSAPYLGGGFGHFYVYAPVKIEYCIDRFTMEIKRQLDVLDQQLADNAFIAGDAYSIADMAIWPWYGQLVLGELYDAAEFISADSYQNVKKWAETIAKRPAVQKGRLVTKS
ncbi:MAG: glutathione-dependent disulfide-bond oxidoreductase [Rickettsiales bacterium]|nr:glutathione-dependent disulfide-bond oxidoreductase [Rickettsiales bacterium]